MAGESATRTVAIEYVIEGVEEATSDQTRLAQSVDASGEAFGEQAEHVARAESALDDMGDAATRSEQMLQRTHQQIQAFASGLGQLSSIIGTESEGGALLGRMSHFASAGIQLGSIFGPAGAVVGGIAGALVPALDSLIASFDGADEAARIANDRFGDTTRALNESARAARQAADDLERWDRAASARQQRAAAVERQGRIGGGEVTTAADARALAESLREQGPTTGIFGISQAQIDQAVEGYERLADEIERAASASSGAPSRRGGGRAQGSQFRSDGGAALRALMQEDPTARFERRGQDAIGFAAGLGDRPQDKAQDESLGRLADKQKEVHDAQMERIQAEVEAWTGAGQKIGATLYDAFQIAATGQEDLDVAMVKGFKNLAIQFGGQMVSEGIGALFTAIGNTVTAPPVAATKAAEGAGKIALGVALGAAGAAIPVPSSGGGGQANAPRLGPQSSGGGERGGSVVVNMNAPAVITGTRAQLGRELSGAIRDARNRFGRAA